MAVIMGIDPGSQMTGYGLIKVRGTQLSHITSGCIRAGNGEIAQRLLLIYESLVKIIATYLPDQVAIEQVFMHKYAQPALVLGHARGVAVLAVAQRHLALFEYSAKQVKQAISGYGGAEKQQVQHMVKLLLSLSALPQVDAADALAVAICHANSRKLMQKGKAL